jgi:hypothetical protein
LGYEEVFAHKILTDYIEERGFTVTRHAYDLKTAFVAEYMSPAAKALIADGHEDQVRTVGFISEVKKKKGISPPFFVFHGISSNY